MSTSQRQTQIYKMLSRDKSQETEVEVASIEGNTLRWTSRAGDEGQVDLDNIVCVVPKPSPQSQQRHRVLYLKRDASASDTSSEEDPSSMRIDKIDIDLSSTPTSTTALTPFLAEIPTYLQGAEPIQVVISTRSGTGTAQTVFENLVKPFLVNLEIQYQSHETKSAQTIIELSETQFLPRASNGVPQTIILLSGDGGLIDILDVFYRSESQTENPTTCVRPNIALIPCGTGNAMASSIGLRSGPADSLSSLLRGKASPLPAFAAKFSPGSRMVVDEGNGRTRIDGTASVSSSAAETSHQIMYGAVVASWGLHAALVADSDTTEYRKFGSDRFQMAAKELLYPSDGSESHRFCGRITLVSSTGDSQPTATTTETIPEEEHMYVLTTLVPRLEKEFLISPDSEALSGKMRFLRFGPLAPDEAMRLMTLAYQGGLHVREECVTYKEVEMVRIDLCEDEERWRRVCIDGKIVAVEKGGWMEICRERRELLSVVHMI